LPAAAGDINLALATLFGVSKRCEAIRSGLLEGLDSLETMTTPLFEHRSRRLAAAESMQLW
jgi:hypothetical protein